MCSLRQRLASAKGPTSRPMAYTFGSSTFAMGLHRWKVRGRDNNMALFTQVLFPSTSSTPDF